MTVKTSGFKELDRALSLLPKTAGKAVLLRSLKIAAAPIQSHAQDLAPVLTGELRESIIVTSKLSNRVGKAEFAAVMKAGGTKAEAGAALRAARSAAKGQSVANVFIGPSKAKSKKDGIKRYAQEFGTINHPPNAYLRPAWDAQSQRALQLARSSLAQEIMKAAKRIGRSKRASYTETIKQEASIAALLAHEVE